MSAAGWTVSDSAQAPQNDPDNGKRPPADSDGPWNRYAARQNAASTSAQKPWDKYRGWSVSDDPNGAGVTEWDRDGRPIRRSGNGAPVEWDANGKPIGFRHFVPDESAPPATLPANFNGWDKPNSHDAPPDTLPADFDGWDKPSSPASPDLTANPKGEGLYQMRTPQGQTVGIPYSKVANRPQGYSFASPTEQTRFNKDFAADPANRGRQAFAARPSWSQQALALIKHPLNSMEAAAQPTQRPANATMGEMAATDLNNVAAGATSVFRHPLRTAGGILSSGLGARPVVETVANALEQPILESHGKQPLYAPHLVPSSPEEAAYAIGQGAAIPALTEAAPAALDAVAASPVGRTASAVRDAAAGNPDAAALRAMNIGPKSRFANRAVSDVQGARPYLQGARTLEDVQARIPQAKREVWGPYQQAVDALADKPVTGPDGRTTVGQLEKERLELSAINRGLKSGDPAALQVAQQKGLTQAQMLDREAAVQRALDPVLQQAGINPKAIRQTFGQLSRVESRFAGRNTLNERPQPYGFGHIVNADLAHPVKSIPEAARAVRDVAGRKPWIAGKPTNVDIATAFRKAPPKPDLGAFNPASRFARPGRELPAPSNIPDAEYEMMPPGSMEGRPVAQPAPSVVTPAPDQVPQLPAQAGPEGIGVPEVEPRTAPPNAAGLTERTRPPLAPNPQPTPPGRTVVTPEGTAIPERKLLTAPKSGKSVRVGDTVTVNGRRGRATGAHSKTGRIQVEWE